MESEKVKEIKKALKYNIKLGLSYEDDKKPCKVWLAEILTLINELEECSKKWQKLCADEVALNTPLKERIKELETLCNKTYEDLTKEIDRLENRVKELEEGIAKSMLGCEFLPECTKEKEKEVAEDFIKEIGKIQLQEYNGAELCLMLDLSQVLKKLAKKYRVKIGE